jgi:hypothetical protein
MPGVSRTASPTSGFGSGCVNKLGDCPGLIVRTLLVKPSDRLSDFSLLDLVFHSRLQSCRTSTNTSSITEDVQAGFKTEINDIHD